MKIKFDTDSIVARDLVSLWHLIGSMIEQRDPTFFAEKRAGETAADTSSINGPDAPDFKLSDNVPPDAFEAGRSAPVASVPLPPNVAPFPVAASPAPLAPLPPPPFSSAPLPPPPGPAPAPEFDSAGVAWDMNLHSGNRSKTIDGKWKARRGLKSVPAGTTAPAPLPPAMPAPPVPLPPNLPVMAPPDDEDGDTVDGGELPTVADAGIDFPTFIARITSGMQDGSVTQARIEEVMKANQLESLFSLNTQPEKIGVVSQAFGF